VFCYHELELVVTDGRRFGTEFGTEPPAKMSVYKWHKLFNRTGRVKANALISDESLNERHLERLLFAVQENQLACTINSVSNSEKSVDIESHKRKPNSPRKTKRLATYFVATLYPNFTFC
jgi:hypothetical protein